MLCERHLDRVGQLVDSTKRLQVHFQSFRWLSENGPLFVVQDTETRRRRRRKNRWNRGARRRVPEVGHSERRGRLLHGVRTRRGGEDRLMHGRRRSAGQLDIQGGSSGGDTGRGAGPSFSEYIEFSTLRQSFNRLIRFFIRLEVVSDTAFVILAEPYSPPCSPRSAPGHD